MSEGRAAVGQLVHKEGSLAWHPLRAPRTAAVWTLRRRPSDTSHEFLEHIPSQVVIRKAREDLEFLDCTEDTIHSRNLCFLRYSEGTGHSGTGNAVTLRGQVLSNFAAVLRSCV